MTKEEVLEYINHEIERSMEYDIEPTSTLKEIKEMVENIEEEKERIIKELEEKKQYEIEEICLGEKLKRDYKVIHHQGKFNGIQEAIEIVKRGGKE